MTHLSERIHGIGQMMRHVTIFHNCHGLVAILDFKEAVYKSKRSYIMLSVKSCLEAGADVNAKKMGKTALDCLAETNEEKHFITYRYFDWDCVHFYLDVVMLCWKQELM